MSYKVYSFSYNNPKRYEEMNHRFKVIHVPLHWIEAVGPDDIRVKRLSETRKNDRNDAMTLSHLKAIQTFFESDVEYGIICEDDIYIRKSFSSDIKVAIEAYKRLGASVLLLGYLLSYNPIKYESKIVPIEEPFVYFNVYNSLWGSQMYLINKKTAKLLLERFLPFENFKIFSPDWTITKIEKSMFMYPMLAVEKVYPIPEDDLLDPQILYHRKCCYLNYNPKSYI